MTRVRYDDWAVDANGDVVSGAQVEVRRVSDNALANLHTAESGGSAIVNPFLAGDGDPDPVGKVSFWVAPGVYDITVGSGASATTVRKYLDAPFGNRAALVAAVADGSIWPNGTIIFDGTVSYKAVSGSTDIPDLSGLTWASDAPFPDHFKENSGDMTAAFDACGAVGKMRLRAATYLVSGTANFNADKILIEGAGIGQTIIQCENATANVFELTDVNSIYGAKIGGFDIVYTGAGNKTAGYAIYSDKRLIESEVSNIRMVDMFEGVRLYASGRVFVDNIMFITQDRDTSVSPAARGLVIDADSANAGRPTDLHITDFQIMDTSGGAVAAGTFGIHIRGADGVYINGGHIHGMTYGLRVEPADADNRRTLASISVDQVYFDTAYEGHVFLVGDANDAYRKLDFTACQFRDARGVNGSFVVASTDPIVGVKIVGCTFDDNDASAIRCVDTADAVSWTISNNLFRGNNTDNLANHGDIYLGGEGHTISGNTHTGGGANGVGIQVLSADCLVTSNNLAKSTAGTPLAAMPSGSFERINLLPAGMTS